MQTRVAVDLLVDVDRDAEEPREDRNLDGAIDYEEFRYIMSQAF